MLKNITQILLDPKSEKALGKALETMDMNAPDQRQALRYLIIENQTKLSDSPLLPELKDIRLLFELYFEVGSDIQNTLVNNIIEGLNAESQQNKTAELLEHLSSLKNQQGLNLFASYCNIGPLCEKAVAELALEDKKRIVLEGKSEASKKHILASLSFIDELKQLEKNSLNKDKKTTRLIQERIDQLEQILKQKQDFIAQRDKLLESMASLARGPHNPLFDSKLQYLQESWSDFETSLNSNDVVKPDTIITEAMRQDIDQHIQQCETIIQQHQQIETQKLKSDNDKAFLEGAIAKLEPFFKTETFDEQAVQALIESIESKLANTNNEAIQFDHKQFKQYLQAYAFEQGINKEDETNSAEQKHLEELQALFDSNHKRKKAEHSTLRDIREKMDQIKARLKNAPTIHTPSKHALETHLKAIQAFEKQCLNMQEEFKQKFDKKTGYIKSEIDNKALTTVKRLYKEAENLLQYCPEKQQETLKTRLEKHKQEIEQLEDWYNFATLPKRRELLEEMQALAKKAPQTKIKELKDAIKALQNRWKELGHARDEEGKKIWQAFQEAGDQAFQPVKNLIERKEKEKSDNLETRNKVIETLQKLLEENFPAYQENDWAQAEKQLRKAQRDWLQAFPIPNGNQELEQVFSQLTEQLNEKLLPQRKINLGKKNTLVSKAEKLTHMEDNREAIEEAKKLQHEWKSIGFSDEDESLWLSFREHCDKIFEHRNEIRDEQKNKEKSAIEQASALCLALENIDSEDAREFQQEYKKLCSQFEDIKAIPKKRSDIFKQFSKAKKNAQARLKHLQQAQENKLFEQLLELSQKCARIEQAVIDKQLQCEEALAQFDELQNNYQIDNKLKESLRNSIQSLSEAKDKSTYTEEQIKQLRELCVSLEIDMDIDSPAQDQSLRMEIQVQRLNKKFNQGEKNLSVNEKIISAYLLGGIYSYQDASYAQRLQNLQNKLNG